MVRSRSLYRLWSAVSVGGARALARRAAGFPGSGGGGVGWLERVGRTPVIILQAAGLALIQRSEHDSLDPPEELPRGTIDAVALLASMHVQRAAADAAREARKNISGFDAQPGPNGSEF